MLKKLIPFLVSALLLAGAIAWDSSSRKFISDDSIAKKIAENLDREFSSLQKEAMRITADTLNTSWSSLHYSFYLIDSGRITDWSNNNIAIDVSELAGDFKLRLRQNPRMDLILCKFPSRKGSLVAVLPLRTGYEIVNRYLITTWNERVFPTQGLKIISPGDSLGAAVCSTIHGCLFRVQIPDGAFFENPLSLVITLGAILFALSGTYLWVRDRHRKRNYLEAFLILFGSLAAIRIAMVQFLFPGRWIYSKFFDPKYFASSSFNASVGDFFLNALIVAIASAYLFKTYSRLVFVKSSFKRNDRAKGMISVLLLTASFFSFLFPHLFVESIFHDSAISIDITSFVDFDGLRIMALGALILGCLSSFFFVHMWVRWTKFLVKSRLKFIFYLLTSAIMFVGYFVFSELNYWPTLFIGLPFFLLLYFSNYFGSLSAIGYQTFSFLLIAVIAYAIQGALGIWRFAEEKEVRSMFRSASNLINRDVLGEYLLNETVKKITEDQSLALTMASPLSAKSAVRQKVRLIHLSNYFDRYEVKVSLYFADGSSADNESEDFITSIKTLEGETNKTSYEGIYFIRNTASETVKRYLAVVPITGSRTLGYVVLDLSSKQIVPQQVYPELLVDNRFSQSLRNKNYSYAFFRQKGLVSSIGSFNFDRDFNVALLDSPLLYSAGLKTNGHWLVGAEDESGKQAIVSAEVNSSFFSIANFSFLFVLGVILIFLTLIIYFVTRWRKRLDLNYSARIQLYIYISFILPLVVVSTIALRMISQSEEAQLEKEIREKGLRITESMSELLGKTAGDSLAYRSELKKKLVEVSQSTFTDANLYIPSGGLIASSQPTIFSSQLVMPLANRASWEKISMERFNMVQERCRIGLLDYNSLFFAIKPPGKNNLSGILELPFFQSNSESAKTSVLSNILVTFVIVFIFFSVFAFTAINKLTSPLRFIAKKLKMTSLGNNQPMEWNADDEIGLLVKEYNRMLGNLEQNKSDLARSQKETAWREIAQQVAHEIKNPLTPMKLTLQQLAQGIADGSINKERTKKSVNILLSQVEILNGIASSFNSFATMPMPVLKQVEVISLLRNTVALFENESKGLVYFEIPTLAINILGDDQLLVRIFSNIILNGIQSRSGSDIRILITIDSDRDGCVIKFQDNGSGIAADLCDKIFLPHFTTKESGSGLGLAIAKQGIEQMGGSIWFVTEEGKGSTFFVKLKKS
jgi:two-component system, NtrC family, nitrogen regulation sensor histidine kinase NtrY